MLKNFLRSIIPLPLHLSRSRGQVMVLYALLIPLMFLFVGVGLDLGWYYLNVSRLQNAADAAALAGARTIINSNSGKLKDLAPVLVQKLPADNGLTDDGEPKVETSTSTETTQISTETDEGTTITTTETTTTTTTTISKTKLEDLTLTDGDATARNYTAKDLGTTQNIQADEGEVVSLIIDKWSLFKSPDEQKVDADLNLVKVNGDFYYIVKLDENIRHFFLPGWFDGMDAKVVAIAQLVPLDQKEVDISTKTKTWEEFIAKIEEYKNKNVVVGNWEVQNIYRQPGNKAEFENRFGYEIYDGKWNLYQDSKNHYKAGNNRRTETINITPAKTGNSFSETSANGKKYYDKTQVESLDIDFKPEVQFRLGSKWLAEDWDLEFGYDNTVALDNMNSDWNTSGNYKKNDIRTMRIHSTINFDEPYEARPNAEDDPDILWVRIESETMLHYPDSPNGEASKKGEDMRSFNSVHQIIINFNSDNTEKSTDGKDIYRPVIIFYDGPETNDTYYDSHKTNEDVLHRESLPVIVNLNADFQGVLYMPNSPVVLNDNGYKFDGFIVAKNYLKLKTENDFYQDEETGKYYDNVGKTTEYFKISETKNGKTNTMFIDEKGNVQYGNADRRTKYGTYATFGRTDFTTHQYHIAQTSADNLLLSGK